jgi:hypothetical protein
MGSVLVDATGQPIPDGEERERAEKSLPEFLDRNKTRLEEFWRHYGMGARPPLKWDLRTHTWHWIGE